MKRFLPATVLAATLAAAAPIALAHTDGPFAFGRPGTAQQVTKTIHVRETDQMKLIFDRTDIRRGDTVKFVVTNTGVIAHEFGVADEAGEVAHRREMAAMPGMHHDDPNVISLAPGETRTLIWQFAHVRDPHLVFACNVPGHYQGGMFVRVTLR